MATCSADGQALEHTHKAQESPEKLNEARKSLQQKHKPGA